MKSESYICSFQLIFLCFIFFGYLCFLLYHPDRFRYHAPGVYVQSMYTSLLLVRIGCQLGFMTVNNIVYLDMEKATIKQNHNCALRYHQIDVSMVVVPR
jgi:hypothetical protein